jgi:hypothetical protein
MIIMSDDFDFDKYWLRVFSMCVEDYANEEIKNQILLGSEEISSETPRQEVFDWSQQAMKKLDELVDEDQKYEIMTTCSCQYPRSNLQKFKDLYDETKDVRLVHQKMQEYFEIYLKEQMKVEDKYIQEIIKRGMGMAGKFDGKTIIATKIPKSAFIPEWFEETDSNKKRALFCHCPRIRDVLDDPNNELPKEYCLCGAGFYKGIWEFILSVPVKVEVLETVMKGDEVCKIGIYLPFKD